MHSSKGKTSSMMAVAGVVLSFVSQAQADMLATHTFSPRADDNICTSKEQINLAETLYEVPGKLGKQMNQLLRYGKLPSEDRKIYWTQGTFFEADLQYEAERIRSSFNNSCKEEPIRSCNGEIEVREYRNQFNSYQQLIKEVVKRISPKTLLQKRLKKITSRIGTLNRNTRHDLQTLEKSLSCDPHS